MVLEETIISIYVRIDDELKLLLNGKPLRKRGFPPELSDAEVLTMEIIGEMEGRNGDRAIWRYFQDHWLSLFPALHAFKTFAKRCANLLWIKSRLLERLFPATDRVHIIDGVPLALCHFARAKRAKGLASEAAWGYCAAKKDHYFGFKGHILMALRGTISSFTLTPANVDERVALMDFQNQFNGLLLGDKGYLNAELSQELKNYGIDLQTPMRDNMPDMRDKTLVSMMMTSRKRIETALSMLCTLFNLTRIKAHDMWHYSNKLTRKILAYNFYVTRES